MTVKEVWNRGNNLVAASVVALSGFGFFGEFFSESEWYAKLDEGIMLVLGLIAIAWYWTKNNRFTRSFWPVALLILGLADKIMAVYLERADAEDVGDDLGGVTIFLLGTILVWWLYTKAKNVEDK
ncbi:MAG TPA: hypothetical protein VHA78_06035 [Candidatus Peribacteraceae bacterium]|nr:hypothetical protein [Candidatus Peribacteraceae bacterium]